MSYPIKFGVQGATELHVLDQVGALTLVWGDDANLVGFGSSFQQSGGDLLYIGSLSPWKHQHQLNSILPSTGTFKVYASELENANHADLQDYLLAKSCKCYCTMKVKKKKKCDYDLKEVLFQHSVEVFLTLLMIIMD